MNCAEVRDMIAEFVDRELAAPADAAVRLHLDRCAVCRAEYEKVLAGWQALDAWEDVRPPEMLKDKIIRTVRPERRYSRMRVLVPLAAAILLFVSVSLYYAGQKTGIMQVATQSQEETVALGDVSEDEIIANLDMLRENELLDALDELVKLDILPLMDEPIDPEKSSLEQAST